jgi:hypothetical protein
MLRARSTMTTIRMTTRATTVRKSISVLFYVWTTLFMREKGIAGLGRLLFFSWGESGHYQGFDHVSAVFSYGFFTLYPDSGSSR